MAHQPHSEPANDTTPSLTSRLAQSATGLANNLISRAAGSSMISELAASTVDPGKVQASSSGSSAELSTWARQRSLLGSRDAAAGQGLAHWESFRSEHDRQRRAQETKVPQRIEETWGFIDHSFEVARNIDNMRAAALQPSLFGGSNRRAERGDYDEVATHVEAAWIEQYQTSLQGKGKERQASIDIAQRSTPNGTSWPNDFNGSDSNSIDASYQTDMAGSRLTMLNANDGAEVVALLSDPQSTIDVNTLETDMNDLVDVSAEDLFGGSMTDGEETATKRIKSALPPPPEHGRVAPQNPLNLRPNFEALLARDVEDPVAVLPIFSYNAVLDLPNKWDEVINHYTDNVWGSFVPELEYANQNIKEIVGGRKPTTRQAVRRLEMILSHLRLPDGELGLHHKRRPRAETEAAALAIIEALMSLEAVRSEARVWREMTDKLNVLAQMRTLR